MLFGTGIALYIVAPGETSGELKNGGQKMEKFRRKSESRMSKITDPVVLLTRVDSLVLWLSQEDAENMRTVLRLELKIITNRLRELL